MKRHIIRKSKFNRLINHDILSNSAVVSHGFWGLVSKNSCFIYETHVQALRKVLKFHYRRRKKQGTFFINLFMTQFLTKKAIGVRMGKGKGSISKQVFFMRPGHLILFLNDLNFFRSFYVIKKCMRRLPVRCRIVRFNVW